MKKSTKVTLFVLVAGIGGYLLWKSRQPKKNAIGVTMVGRNRDAWKVNATGDCGCGK